MSLLRHQSAWRWPYTPKHVALLNIVNYNKFSLTDKITIDFQVKRDECHQNNKFNRNSPGRSVVSRQRNVLIVSLHWAIAACITQTCSSCDPDHPLAENHCSCNKQTHKPFSNRLHYSGGICTWGHNLVPLNNVWGPSRGNGAHHSGLRRSADYQVQECLEVRSSTLHSKVIRVTPLLCNHEHQHNLYL
jgi:hypothetical protein